MKHVILILLSGILLTISPLATSSSYAQTPCIQGTAVCSTSEQCRTGVSICPSQTICAYNPAGGGTTCTPLSVIQSRNSGNVPIGTLFSNNLTRYFTSIGGLVSGTLNQVFLIALIIVLIYFILAAYKYMISGGDPKNIAAAKGQITWAAIGMFVIVLSFGLFQVVNILLGSPF